MYKKYLCKHSFTKHLRADCFLVKGEFQGKDSLRGDITTMYIL